jgi:hypothetical protein
MAQLPHSLVTHLRAAGADLKTAQNSRVTPQIR